MKTDVGLFDRLFGKRGYFEVAGPDGQLRQVSVTMKWMEQMQREGKISVAPKPRVRAHVLHPTGPGRAPGVARASAKYYVTDWIVGVDVPHETVTRFLDEETQCLYALVLYDDDGKPKPVVFPKNTWDGMHAKLDIL